MQTVHFSSAEMNVFTEKEGRVSCGQRNMELWSLETQTSIKLLMGSLIKLLLSKTRRLFGRLSICIFLFVIWSNCKFYKLRVKHISTWDNLACITGTVSWGQPSLPCVGENSTLAKETRELESEPVVELKWENKHLFKHQTLWRMPKICLGGWAAF